MRVKYSKLFNLGNFQNETCGVEMDFPDDVRFSTALTELMDAVQKDHDCRIRIHEVVAHIETCEHYIKVYSEGNFYEGASEQKAENEKAAEEVKKDLTKLKKELGKLEKQLKS